MATMFPTPLPADIAVLMGSGRACPLRKGQRIGAFETTTDQAAEPSKVLLETVRRFKGLERPVIVLTGIDDLPAGSNGTTGPKDRCPS